MTTYRVHFSLHTLNKWSRVQWGEEMCSEECSLLRPVVDVSAMMGYTSRSTLVFVLPLSTTCFIRVGCVFFFFYRSLPCHFILTLFSHAYVCVRQVPDHLRESLCLGPAPDFEMLRKGGVFLQSDEVSFGGGEEGGRREVHGCAKNNFGRVREAAEY